MFENQKTISSQEQHLIPEQMGFQMPFQHLSFPQGPHICQPESLHISPDFKSRKARHRPTNLPRRRPKRLELFIKKEKLIAKR